ncbi:MAG: tripartite tricarboxylate transporter substrate binding protein, partial [Betaproteobacteria bacterium]|nr:tripartite tricarboxylate transporter substrate binding protein [Betaproteobacteria bacterium]
GVTSLKPSAALPGVPPIADALPGYEFSAWFAVVAPKGTPRDIIATLNGHFNKAVASPELAKRFAEEGIDAIGGTPEQLGTFLENEYKKFARVVKERRLKTD